MRLEDLRRILRLHDGATPLAMSKTPRLSRASVSLCAEVRAEDCEGDAINTWQLDGIEYLLLFPAMRREKPLTCRKFLNLVAGIAGRTRIELAEHPDGGLSQPLGDVAALRPGVAGWETVRLRVPDEAACVMLSARADTLVRYHEGSAREIDGLRLRRALLWA